MCGRVDIGVEVVGCRVGEFGQGGALGVQNQKTEPPGLIFGLHGHMVLWRTPVGGGVR